MTLNRKFFTFAMMVSTLCVAAENVSIAGQDYQMDMLQRRDLGPGTTYTRWRIPDYPLNVNVITVDLTNPYNRIETMQANERTNSTEKLVSASQRLTYTGHKVLGGANGNFWCVSGQNPWSDLLVGTTFGGNMRNSKIITETNAYSDQWCGGPQATCVIACDSYKRLWIEPMLWKGTVSSSKIPKTEVIQVNKVVRENEIGMYNSFYTADKAFQPVNQVDGHFVITPGDATEVYLRLCEGQQWQTGSDMRFTIGAISHNAGTGHLGDYDMALVARGSSAQALSALAEGDEIVFNHGWTSYSNGQTPILENLIQGLSLCMRDGVKIDEGNNNSYNAMVYSRTGYGSSADGKTLYMIVIDKSTDEVYGASKGCNTADMCDIALSLGCANLSGVDAGGSAQMLVGDKVVNRTTEGTPRAIANGWLAFSTAPEENEVARLAFYDLNLRVPPYSSSTPRVIAYNKYGDIIDDMFLEYEISCDPSLGHGDGCTFIADKGGQSGTITASYNGISVSTNVDIIDSQVKLRLNPILIDASREYFVEVSALLDDNEYSYDPTELSWASDDPTVAFVDHHGILRGLKEGTTYITGSIGEFTDRVPVTVEIAPSARAVINDWNSWEAKGTTGMTVNTFKNGTISYTYKTPRQARMSISKELVFYSLPDAFDFTFSSSVAVTSIEVDLRTRWSRGTNNITILPTDGESFAAGVEHTVSVPLPADGSELGTYPITMHKINLIVDRNSAYNGEQSITLGDFGVNYEHSAAVETVSKDLPVSQAPMRYFNLQGMEVSSHSLTPGLYIRSDGNVTQKIVIR